MIHWSEPARDALRREISYVIAFNPQAAWRMEQRVGEAVNQLAFFPEAGRAGEVEGTRELVVTGTPYIVIYRMETGVAEKRDVTILYVYHAARINPLLH